MVRRVVANTANTAGSSTLTLDAALPNTSYDKFALYGISSGASLVYRKYKVVDADQAAALAQTFTYQQVFTLASGNLATVTSYPMGSVCYSPSGSPPWQTEQPSYFTAIAPPNIIFQTPTFNSAGFHAPSDVRALLPIYTGSLTATKPSSGFEGTSNTIEGLEETLVVTCLEWRDPANQTAMEDYAQDLLDSVKDSICEGTVVYHGLYSAALTPGVAVSVTGDTYTTGWEGLAIPVQEIEIDWNSGEATQHTTVMHCSNRKAHFSSAAFLRPDRSREGSLVSGGLEGLGSVVATATANRLGAAMERAGDVGGLFGTAGDKASGAFAAASNAGAGAFDAAGSKAGDSFSVSTDQVGAGMDVAGDAGATRQQAADRTIQSAAQAQMKEQTRSEAQESFQQRVLDDPDAKFLPGT